MLENKLANLQRLLSDSQAAVEDNTQVKKIIILLNMALVLQCYYMITRKRNKPLKKKRINWNYSQSSKGLDCLQEVIYTRLFSYSIWVTIQKGFKHVLVVIMWGGELHLHNLMYISVSKLQSWIITTFVFFFFFL